MNTLITALVISVGVSCPAAHACSRDFGPGWEQRAIDSAELIFIGRLTNSHQSEGFPHRPDWREFTFAEFEVTHWVKGSAESEFLAVRFANWPVHGCGVIFDLPIGETEIVFARTEEDGIDGWFEGYAVLSKLHDPVVEELMSGIPDPTEYPPPPPSTKVEPEYK